MEDTAKPLDFTVMGGNGDFLITHILGVLLSYFRGNVAYILLWSAKPVQKLLKCGAVGLGFRNSCGSCTFRALFIDCSLLGERQILFWSDKAACVLHMSGNNLRRGRFQQWNLLVDLFQSFFLVPGFEADRLTCSVDLIPEAVDAAFLFLIDGSDVEFNFLDGHFRSFLTRVPDLANIDVF